MLKGQQFGPKHGSLSLHADVRRPERTFWAQLIRVIGTLNDWKSADVNDSDASRKAFAACAPRWSGRCAPNSRRSRTRTA